MTQMHVDHDVLVNTFTNLLIRDLVQMCKLFLCVAAMDKSTHVVRTRTDTDPFDRFQTDAF